MLKIIIQFTFIIALLSSAGGCASVNDDINGHYKYEETLYLTPLSSFVMTKDNADEYIIADDSVTIVHTDGTKEQITASFDKSEVDQEAFTALFNFKAGMPDISVFKKRHQYIIDEQYRLYVMDGEMWIAGCPKDIMWAIYRLVKIGN